MNADAGNLERLLICLDDLAEYCAEQDGPLGAGTYADAASDVRGAAEMIRRLAGEPAGRVPAGWRITENSAGELIVSGPDGGTTVSAARGSIANRTLFGLARSLLAAAPAAQTGNGCPCEPSGSDGLSCPRPDGTLLCQDRAAPAAQGVHVGDSSFEDWYSSGFEPGGQDFKACMRDAYTAGMKDRAAPAVVVDEAMVERGARKLADLIRGKESDWSLYSLWVEETLAAALGQEVGHG